MSLMFSGPMAALACESILLAELVFRARIHAPHS
jgi:hypothetical protein